MSRAPSPPPDAASGPVDLARVRSWPRRVRADIRDILMRGLTLGTSPALMAAVHEITSLVDQAEAEEVTQA